MKLLSVLCCLGITLTCNSAMAYQCSVSATPLSFGMVEGRTGQVARSTATLTVVCQSDVAATVSYEILSETYGQNDRTMTGGNGTANYQLYTSATYQRVWGDTASNAISDSYTLAVNTSQTRVYTVYARMLPGVRVGPGQYVAVSGVRLVY
ncbi:spore coat U domain-containing protein [Pseudomonas syringae]|nr:spore coat U domain-containing protein [Pseudomonas syringae]